MFPKTRVVISFYHYDASFGRVNARENNGMWRWEAKKVRKVVEEEIPTNYLVEESYKFMRHIVCNRWVQGSGRAPE